MPDHVLRDETPEDAGMDPRRIERLRALAGGWVGSGDTPEPGGARGPSWRGRGERSLWRSLVTVTPRRRCDRTRYFRSHRARSRSPRRQ